MIEWVIMIALVVVLGALFKLGLEDADKQEKKVKRVRREPQLFDLKADVVE
jgi:hypothetical protein